MQLDDSDGALDSWAGLCALTGELVGGAGDLSVGPHLAPAVADLCARGLATLVRDYFLHNLESKVHELAGDDYRIPVLGCVKKWIQAVPLQFLHALLTYLGDSVDYESESSGLKSPLASRPSSFPGIGVPSEALLRWHMRLEYFAYETLQDLRIAKLFEIIVDYPESFSCPSTSILSNKSSAYDPSMCLSTFLTSDKKNYRMHCVVNWLSSCLLVGSCHRGIARHGGIATPSQQSVEQLLSVSGSVRRPFLLSTLELSRALRLRWSCIASLDDSDGALDSRPRFCALTGELIGGAGDLFVGPRLAPVVSDLCARGLATLVRDYFLHNLDREILNVYFKKKLEELNTMMDEPGENDQLASHEFSGRSNVSAWDSKMDIHSQVSKLHALAGDDYRIPVLVCVKKWIQEVEQEDRLSKLPDDILLLVLDHVGLRGAVRSGVLSRRWRHLPDAIRSIILDVKRYELKDDGVKSSQSERKARTNMALAEAARSLLARRGQEQGLRFLYLRFYLRDESVDIVGAVDDAIARGCGITKATFMVVAEKIDYRCTDEDLAAHAGRFLSYLDACPRAFACLTKLHLESVKLPQSDIDGVLATCGRLKILSLLNCDSGREAALAIQHPQITVLQLVSCCCDTIELKWLPKLVKVTCECWHASRRRDPLLFGHVPLLRKLALRLHCTSDDRVLRLSTLLDNANIRELEMGFGAAKLWIQPEGARQLAPRLSTLRILYLDIIPEECGITWTFFLLEATPLLRELHVQVSNHQCIPLEDETLVCKKTYIEWEPSDLKRYNLVVLTIDGFQPTDIFMGYIKRIIEVAVNLEEISLYDEFCYECGFCPSTSYPHTKTERDLIRKRTNEGRPSPIKATRFYARPRSQRDEPVEIVDS
ncbi:hypothetical protein ACQ4PT_038228 [Festuca glaucescens]